MDDIIQLIHQQIGDLRESVKRGERPDLNLHCPTCGEVSPLLINETQAVCETNSCRALMFNPSLSDEERAKAPVHEVNLGPNDQ